MTKPKLDDLVVAFYKNQLTRIENHESQILRFSQILVTISIALITFHNQFNSGLQLILLSIVAAFNLLAILFIKTSDASRKIHQARSKRVIEEYSDELYAIINEITYDKKRNTGRLLFLYIFHVILIALAIGLGMYSLNSCCCC